MASSNSISIDETLERIKGRDGVERIIVADISNDQIIRHVGFDSATDENGPQVCYAKLIPLIRFACKSMKEFTGSPTTNVEFLQLRIIDSSTRQPKELMIAPAKKNFEYTLIVIKAPKLDLQM